jgi:hypothetical protein
MHWLASMGVTPDKNQRQLQKNYSFNLESSLFFARL